VTSSLTLAVWGPVPIETAIRPLILSHCRTTLQITDMVLTHTRAFI